MSLIPDEQIERIKERVDLVTLVTNSGVELKKVGRSWRGLCPFHAEKTPSFYVTREKGTFKCFGCQLGGDAIAFLQQLHGKSFLESLRQLAELTGVQLQEKGDGTSEQTEALLVVSRYAADIFSQTLWSEAGNEARSYLAARGVSETIAKEFGLGFATAEWRHLSELFRQTGQLVPAEAAGLIAQSAKGPCDVFRNRLVIPIRSVQGRTIGFGGRALGVNQSPKYLNSKESQLYSKSATLFGLDVAKEAIRKAASALVCEGYFDALALHQAGFGNSVALCGTALTASHLELLRRHGVKALTLIFDGDSAGQSAVVRVAGLILNSGIPCRVAILPDGVDPDTYLVREGREALLALLEKAPYLAAFLLTRLLPEGSSAAFEVKMRAIDELKGTINSLSAGIPRTAFLREVAAHFGVETADVMRQFSVAPNARRESRAADAAPERFSQLEIQYVAARMKWPTLSGSVESRAVFGELPLGLRQFLEQSDGLDAATLQRIDAAAEVLLNSPDAEFFSKLCRRLQLRSIDLQLKALADDIGERRDADAPEYFSERARLLALKRQLLL